MKNSVPDKIKLGVSSCLLGNPVRYDGGHKLDYFLTDTFGRYVEWAPVCPEVECGLPVPREAMRLVGDPTNPRLVTVLTRVDHSSRMAAWAKKKITKLEKEDLCGFVFKSRSPSSGMRGVKIYTEAGMPNATGSGLFARAFMEKFPFLPVEDEARLRNPSLRENFIERIFVYRRWREYIREDGSLGGLVSFHTKHKLLLMSHSQKYYSELGKLVAAAKQVRRDELRSSYLRMLLEGLRFPATLRKNTNVLQHTAGYFKDKLSADEKKEVQDVITNYHRERVPLVVAITLLQHYVRKYDAEYLKQQTYLSPDPLELMLRNHA